MVLSMGSKGGIEVERWEYRGAGGDQLRKKDSRGRWAGSTGKQKRSGKPDKQMGIPETYTVKGEPWFLQAATQLHRWVMVQHPKWIKNYNF